MDQRAAVLQPVSQLEIQLQPELDVAWVGNREQAPEVRVVGLAQPIEFEAFERGDVEGVRIARGEALRNTRMEKIYRQGV